MSFNNKFKIAENSSVNLKKYPTLEDGGYTKETAKAVLKKHVNELKNIQRIFYADGRFSLLIILQAPDTAGKDGVIRHVMSGINPQGCRVHNFQQPSKEEYAHDFLWRHYKVLPKKGMIEIFNRSHYENVLATKVNKHFLLNERLPEIDSIEKVTDEFWENRYEQINNFEKHIYQNGTQILKFFLHLSKDEQKKRLLSRLNKPHKNWKFSTADIEARTQWSEYQKAYEDMLGKTSKEYAPWYVIPADNKHFARVAIGSIVLNKLQSLDLRFPKGETDKILEQAKKKLLSE